MFLRKVAAPWCKAFTWLLHTHWASRSEQHLEPGQVLLLGGDGHRHALHCRGIQTNRLLAHSPVPV